MNKSWCLCGLGNHPWSDKEESCVNMSLSPDSRNKNNWGKYVIYLPPLDKGVLIILTHYVQDIQCSIGHWSVPLPSKTLKTVLVTVAIPLNITYVVFKRWLQSTNACEVKCFSLGFCCPVKWGYCASGRSVLESLSDHLPSLLVPQQHNPHSAKIFFWKIFLNIS